MKKYFFSISFYAWSIFLLFMLLYAISTVGIMNSVDAPQYALTKSLLINRSISIDNYTQYITPDYALYKNHYYSIRSPFESIFAIPFYLIATPLSRLTAPPYDIHHLGITSESTIESLTIIYNAFFGALTITLLFLFCFLLTKDIFASFFSATAFGLGTLFWKYSSTFQRHSALMFFFLLFFYLLHKNLHMNNKFYTFLIGLSCGLCIALDNVYFALLPIVIFIFIKDYFNKSLLKTIKNIIFFNLGFLPPIITIMVFNFLSFEKMFVQPYQYDPILSFFKNIPFVFSNPIFPNVFVNLFNNGPITKTAISQYIWDHPNLVQGLSANWATINSYKGIFIQSPYLFAGLLGSFFLYKKNKLLFFLFLYATCIFLVIFSKFIAFYSPNMYDTRHFLPIVLLLTIPFALTLTWINQLKNFVFFIVLWIGAAILVEISLLNGFVSNITNYAPHITGEHRFTFSQLHYPFYNNLQYNLSQLFVNSFPSYHNVVIIILFYYPLFFILYFVIWKKLLRKLFFLQNIHQTN